MRPCAAAITLAEGSVEMAQLTQDCTSAAMAVVQKQLGVVQAWGNAELMKYFTCERIFELTVTSVETVPQIEAHYHSHKKKKTLDSRHPQRRMRI